MADPDEAEAGGEEQPPAAEEPPPPPPPPSVTFSWHVAGVAGLPCALETVLCVSTALSPAGEHLSAAAEASENPEGWAFEEGAEFTQEIDDKFLDQVCNCPLVFKLLDAGAENALIGQVEVDPVPFLHEKQGISGQLELKLEEAYLAKWQEPKEGEEPPAEGEEPQPREVLPTIATVTVSVSQLIGPENNAEYWSVVDFEIGGAYSLPEKLAVCGNAGPEDAEKNFWKFEVHMLGEELGGMQLADTRFAPTEEDPGPSDEDLDAMPEEDRFLYEAEKRKPSFQLPEGGKGKTVYRGKMFMTTFRDMLNNMGGVWVNILPELKDPTDPKGPQHPADKEELLERFKGKAWFDLRGFLVPGTKELEMSLPLQTFKPKELAEGEEPPESYETSKSYIKAKVKLSALIVEVPGPPDCNALELVNPKPDLQMFLPSTDATQMYMEACHRCVGIMRQEYAKRPEAGEQFGGPEDSAAFLEMLKQRGSYKGLIEELRGSVVRVLREKMRKDAAVVPNAGLTGEDRERFVSESYIVLRETLARVLQDAINAGDKVEDWVSAKQKAREVLNKNKDADQRCAHLAFESELCGNYTRAARFAQNRLVLEQNAKDPEVWHEYAKFLMRSLGRQASAEEALGQALSLLKGAAPVGPTAQLVRNLKAFQSALLIDRGRLKDAEAELTQLGAKDRPDPMVNFLLGICKFLQGGTENIELGLKYMGLVSKPRDWFRGLPDQKAIFSKLMLYTQTSEDAGGDGVSDPDPLKDPQAPHIGKELFRLLDWGLPHLIFTVLDEMGVFPSSVLQRFPALLLAEAKALMIRKNWLAAIDKLTLATAADGSGPLYQATKEELADALRDLCECQFQVERFDDAFASATSATSLVPGEAPVAAFAAQASRKQREEMAQVYIRLGSVLLLKKRWKPAREALLKSIDFLPTAEAWAGVAFAEYRQDDTPAGSQACYEALMEAKLLDEERSDIWAQLSLLHCRLGNQETANSCFSQCMLNNPTNDELLLEIGMSYLRLDFSPTVAEAAARKALQIRDTGRAHDVLGDALAKQELFEKAILELQVAIRMLWDAPDVRQVIFEKALNWCDTLRDAPLAESVHIAQRLSDQKFQQQA